MKFLKLTFFVALFVTTGCAVETKQCDGTSDCFAGESCIENRCLTQSEIIARKKKDAGVDQSSNNGGTNNGTENNGVAPSCVENGTLNVGEDCEPGLQLTESCESLGYDSGALKCKTCQFDTSDCVTEESTCGDGVINGVEACDGTSFDGKTCESVVGTGSTGELSCSDSCGVNTSQCSTVFISISANSNHTCAVNSQGRITCWGDADAETLQPLVGKYVEVSTALSQTCGLKRDGQIVCWGQNFGRNLDAPEEEKFEGGLSSSSNGSCAIKPDKTVRCWGDLYQTGVTQTGPFTQVSAGGTHACGVSEGAINCWKGMDDIMTVPVADDNATFVQVDAGHNFSCAVMSNDNIVCWDREGAHVETPPGQYTKVSVLVSHVCALGTDKKITCWGGGNGVDYGQNTPPTDDFSDVTAGRYHGCGITIDGKIKCWGRESLRKNL